MKIAFFDGIGWDYQIESAYRTPLGGTQSAVCYFAETPAKKGHTVYHLNSTSQKSVSRSTVLRNGIAPSYSVLFPPETAILEGKTKPPVLAYTSTPFRGLDILLDIFPQIRSTIPRTTLKFFSSKYESLSDSGV